MTFEEEFPSLKGCGKLSYRDGEDYVIEAIFQSAVQKHCLDKAKVKEVIDNLPEGCGGDWPSIKDYIEEELGLK